ncbi:Transposase, partial [Salmonella enterica subsp. enterica serovar Newport str. SHSN008]
MQSRTVYQWQSRRDDRALTVVDNFSRECLASHAGKSLKGEDVVRIMEALKKKKDKKKKKKKKKKNSE